MNEEQTRNLKFIIIGGGISGLTCAYLLKKAGHDVIVVEKSREGDSHWNGGLRVPPNMTRLLQELPGSQELLQTKAKICTGFHFVQCENTISELIGTIDLGNVTDDLGGNFYTIPHKDLHSYLLSLCVDNLVQFKYSFEVTEILTGMDMDAGVISTQAEFISGNIVIGADGKNSVARMVLLAEQDDSEDTESDESIGIEESTVVPLQEFTGATISVSVDSMKDHPELLSLLNDDHWFIWMGNGTSIGGVQYGPELYTADLTYGHPAEAQDLDESWESESPMETIRKHINEYEYRIKKIFELASSCHWSIQKIHKLKRYVSKYDQIALIGDAAHAICINGTHNTSCAFEDAITLSRLFSRVSSTNSEHRALLLNGFECISHNRARMHEKYSVDTVQTLGAPPGRARDGRNRFLGTTLSPAIADNEIAAHIWSSYVEQFNYDARDAVDEWWISWVKPRGMI